MDLLQGITETANKFKAIYNDNSVNHLISTIRTQFNEWGEFMIDKVWFDAGSPGSLDALETQELLINLHRWSRAIVDAAPFNVNSESGTFYGRLADLAYGLRNVTSSDKVDNLVEAITVYGQMVQSLIYGLKEDADGNVTVGFLELTNTETVELVQTIADGLLAVGSAIF